MTSRRLRRASLAALVLAAVGFVPRASAAGDPSDPSTPSPADPLGNADTGPQCTARLITPPAGFTTPSGIPAQAPCIVTRLANGTTTTPAGTNYTGVGTLGLQGAPRVAQWVKIPTALSAAVVPIHTLAYTAGTSPAGELPNATNVFYFYPQVWFISADHKRAGEMPPFRVRTLAFGSIPVQVTVHITQPTNPDGTVEPIKVSQANPITNTTTPASGVVRDAHGSGPVNVRLSDLEIDGVAFDVGDRCQTRTTGELRLRGLGYSGPQSQPVPAGRYNGAQGGLLSGTVDIPSFTGCRGGSGDDVSPLITNAISGNGNPISINQTRSSTQCYPIYNAATCNQPLAPLQVPTTRPVTRDAPPAS